ncbi:unnamed protein product [Rotaria socialis]|uniref:Endonuclease/exonuclease/phosphatase domain-containing protein n=1 Tax=Rotaria socialis TaxID=392032 RepID=A0A818V4S3_9BILA|nr:unnamed protein product [Rotaria socialis]
MKATYILRDSLNKRSLSRPYSMVLSGRVERSTSKEQFIFFNRESTSGVKLIDNYLYDDKSNYFERPPQTSTSLAQALSENVVDAAASHKPRLKTNHPILIVGDCNADCSYISLTRQQSLHNGLFILKEKLSHVIHVKIFHFSSINYADFVWMINNQVKTNKRQTCTYDRILINDDKFVGAIVPGSNITVNFQQDFDLRLNEALDVSDRFPVKFDIRW